MKSEISKIERNELCIRSEDVIDCKIAAWTLSKGFNAIYIEKNEKVLGYINPVAYLDAVKKNKSLDNQLIKIEDNYVDDVTYKREQDKSIFFKNQQRTYIPILRDGDIVGELMKRTQSSEEDNRFWTLINTEVYVQRLSKMGTNILFSTLDSTTQELYKILGDTGKFNISVYNPDDIESNSIEDHSSNLVIFHCNNREMLYIEDRGTKYITLDYLYYYLIEVAVLEFYKKNNIKYYYVQVPNIDKLPEYIKKDFYPFLLNNLPKDSKWLDKFYGENKNRQFWESRDYRGVAVIKKGIGRCLKDYKSEHYNVIDGKRITVGAPKTYINSIHCYGPCIVRGAAVNDDSTICSYLQKKINDEHKNWIRVINYGVGGGTGSICNYYNMMQTTYRSGDIVIYFGSRMYSESMIKEFGINIINPLQLFTKQNITRPSFINSAYHVTHIVNKLLAEYIYSILDYSDKKGKNSIIEEIRINTEIDKIEEKLLYKELEEFKKKLTRYQLPDYMQKKIGSIVMNCNPFTLGHLYLIQESLKYVDYLYVFVVEEDKSFFKFKDRIELVKAACRDFKNVMVIASDKFIVSTLTFPEYFFKEELKEVSIDPSKDIRLFGKEVAPVLNITVRFVGEEPIDKVTAQYNQFLKDELKWYNIKVIEVPRKCINGQVISASAVRRLIKEGKIEATKDLVPPTTYKFIVDKFS